jgi:hypothetical protein
MPISARLALVLLLVAALPGDSSPFAVGVLRRDGIVLPFAAFDGKNWKMPWPEDVNFVETEDAPATLDAVPRDWWGKSGPATRLTAWASGVSRGPINLDPKAPTLLRVMCKQRVALRSDYRSSEPAPPRTTQPYPKDGLAVSGDQRVDPIQILSPESAEWSDAAHEMTADFDEAEERAAHSFTDWRHPFDRVERRRYVPRIEAMYGAPMDEAGWNAYYLEAVRLYPPGPADRGCGLVTSASGWMKVGPNGKRSFDLRARITYCDREGVGYMLPLGLIKAAQRHYWVYQISGYGRESYVVVRPRPKEIVPEVVYSGGLCGR